MSEMLNEAAARLRAAGIEAPLVEARILLAHVLKVPLSRLDLLVNSPAEPEVAERYAELVAERATRRPLAYVIGDTEFMGLRFRCDERALVPRPETEVLMEAVVDGIAGHEVVLDIGTGTGAIGLSVAALAPEVRVVLTDISAAALELARENAQALGVAERVRFLEGRDLEPVLAAGLAEEITCVVSNPPYVAPGDVPGLPPEVALHEPRVAWLGEGELGTGVYERLIPQCAERLPNVRLVAFEVGIGQAGIVRDLCERAWPAFETGIVKDLSGIERVVIAQRR